MAAAAMLALAGGIVAVPIEQAAASTKARSSSTRGDVRALQRKVGVAADGVFGPATRAGCEALAAPARPRRGRHRRPADAFRDGAWLGGGAEAQARAARGRDAVAPGGRTIARTAAEASGRSSAGSACPRTGSSAPGTEAALKRWQAATGSWPTASSGRRRAGSSGLGPGRVLKRRGRGGGGGSGGGRIHRLIRAGNRIASAPYKYGGGHGTYHDSGYDCSGSVSYALHYAGLLRTPLDSSGFMSYGLPGRGRHITIYANSGHAYMVVDGRRFDTSAIRETGSRWTQHAPLDVRLRRAPPARPLSFTAAVSAASPRP